MASANACDVCYGNPQGSSSRIDSNSSQSWDFWVTADQLCVELSNGSMSDATVELWATDTLGNTIADVVSVVVPAEATVYQCFSGFGYNDDGVTPVDMCRLVGIASISDACWLRAYSS